MSEKPKRINQYMDRMVEFCKLPPSMGVNNFIISGPIRNEQVKIKSFIGMFPNGLSDNEYELAIGQVGEKAKVNVLRYYSEILDQTIDDRVSGLQAPDDFEVALKNREVCLRNNLPVYCLGFGHYKKDDAEVVVLYAVQGISPATAITKLQNIAREKISKLN